MSVPFVDLAPDHEEVAAELEAALRSVFRRSFFILGEELEAFEREFAAYTDVGHCIGVGSGTEALHLALRACEVGPGDEVILPSHTFVATALAVAWTGATSVFVDIDPQTYTLDPAQTAAAVTAKTKVIVPVHLYGQTADAAPLASLAAEHGLRLVEDAAQAHGAMYQGKRAGTLGDLACFSFYPTKNLGAVGDAGAVVTSDDALAERLRSLRNYGQREKYRHEEMGFNSRLDELQAAVLRVKLRRLEEWNEARRRIAAAYGERLAGVLATPVEAKGRRHVYHLYVVEVDHRERVREELGARGIGTQVHYPIPSHLQPLVAGIPHRTGGDLSVTERVADRVLSLPIYPSLTEAQIDEVAEAVADSVG